jgi:hypothetical protein
MLTVFDNPQRIEPLSPAGWKQAAAVKAKEYNGEIIYINEDFSLAYKKAYAQDQPSRVMFDLDYYEVEIMGKGKFADEDSLKKQSGIDRNFWECRQKR